MSSDDPRLSIIDRMRRGEAIEPEEPLLTLKALATRVRKDASWLSRLGVQQQCGHRLAGSRRYRLSEVLAYLGSEKCRNRIAQLHEQRRRREKETV